MVSVLGWQTKTGAGVSRFIPKSLQRICTADLMLLTAVKSLDTTFTAVQSCLLPSFLLDLGNCVHVKTVKSLGVSRLNSNSSSASWLSYKVVLY